MATSGTVAFAPTMVDIFEEAFERATGDELRHGYQVRSMRRSLNLLLLDWQNRGYNLWQLANRVTYALPNTSTVALDPNCVDTIDVLVGSLNDQTTLATALDGVTTTVVLATPLAADATEVHLEHEVVTVTAGFGTTTLTVVRSVTDASPHDTGSAVFIAGTVTSEIAITRRSVPDYAAIPNKTSTGRPSTMLVRREASPVTLTLWPVPDRAYTVSYWYLRRAEDAGTGGNNPDVPLRFVPALIAGLAYFIAQKTPKAMQNLPILEMQYMDALKAAQSEDREKATLRAVPIAGYRRI